MAHKTGASSWLCFRVPCQARSLRQSAYIANATGAAVRLDPETSYSHSPNDDFPTTSAVLGGRNLGSAIILAAIKDYHSLHYAVHESAAQFLFPTTAEWKAQYNWAVALAEGLNAVWLRQVLDRSRAIWDVQRLSRARCMKGSSDAGGNREKRP